MLQSLVNRNSSTSGFHGELEGGAGIDQFCPIDDLVIFEWVIY